MIFSIITPTHGDRHRWHRTVSSTASNKSWQNRRICGPWMARTTTSAASAAQSTAGSRACRPRPHRRSRPVGHRRWRAGCHLARSPGTRTLSTPALPGSWRPTSAENRRRRRESRSGWSCRRWGVVRHREGSSSGASEAGVRLGRFSVEVIGQPTLVAPVLGAVGVLCGSYNDSEEPAMSATTGPQASDEDKNEPERQGRREIRSPEGSRWRRDRHHAGGRGQLVRA